MNKQVLSIIFFLLYSLILVSQVSECDVLVKKLQVLSNDYQKLDPKDVQTSLDSLNNSIYNNCDKAKIETLIIQGNLALSNGKIDDSFKYLNSALELAKDDVKYSKSILHNLANVHTRNEDFQAAFDLLENAVQIPCQKDSLNCYRKNVIISISSALNLRKMYRYEEAILKYEIAEKILKEHKIIDSLSRAAIFNAMGNIYDAEFEDKRKSLDFYKKSFQFIPKEHKGRYSILTNMGRMYRELDMIDSAYYSFNKTINEVSDPWYLIIAYQGLGALANRAKDYTKGAEMYGLALKNAEASNKKASIYRCQIYLTKSHFLNGDFQKARTYLNSAVKTREGKEVAKEYQIEIDQYSHMLEVARLDPELSYKINQDFLNYDTIAINSRTETLNKSITKYEKLILRDSLDKAVLKEENAAQKAKNYKLSSLALILGLLLLCGMAFQLKNLLKKQRTENDELVFEINELKSINLQLENQSPKSPDLDVKSKIQIQIKDHVHIFDCNQIKYLKAEDFGTRIFLDDSSQWTDSSLKLLKTQFPENNFVQIFRSTIVNIDHIASINTVSLKLKDETELKIGRTYKRAIKDAVIKKEEE